MAVHFSVYYTFPFSRGVSKTTSLGQNTSRTIRSTPVYNFSSTEGAVTQRTTQKVDPNLATISTIRRSFTPYRATYVNNPFFVRLW